MLKALVRQADTVLLMVRGTMNGLSRLRPLSRMVSAVATTFSAEVPPEPMISPVRGSETSSSPRPASSMACCMAMVA